MLSALPKPLLLAHRGASAYAPENTLAAFQLALQQGAHGVELDAKLSADGAIVVMHDASVDRTTNGSGKVKELPLAA
ncbi:MAG: glycerophosphoryl diester phosphodiesterase, partial [Rhodocyclaceae bacterium]|nr:glycerophosphoryl diester phosphodiesterase [Rhodocyclaceae bacterium]